MKLVSSSTESGLQAHSFTIFFTDSVFGQNFGGFSLREVEAFSGRSYKGGKSYSLSHVLFWELIVFRELRITSWFDSCFPH